MFRKTGTGCETQVANLSTYLEREIKHCRGEKIAWEGGREYGNEHEDEQRERRRRLHPEQAVIARLFLDNFFQGFRHGVTSRSRETVSDVPRSMSVPRLDYRRAVRGGEGRNPGKRAASVRCRNGVVWRTAADPVLVRTPKFSTGSEWNCIV